ncbi:hypothetical protein L837_0796 [Mycobacterium avium MAV_061107_1842]|nr:hypothetical protein L837_0796 [Mycobacterium avium MAV_061107_1842]
MWAALRTGPFGDSVSAVRAGHHGQFIRPTDYEASLCL